MPSTAIASGILLILIGVIGFIISLVDGNTSLTALIPAAFGLVIAILGFAAKSNEGLRKHLMHAAVVVALLGFLIPAGRILSRLGDISFSFAVNLQIAMALVCLVFVILSVKSFIDARRSGNV